MRLSQALALLASAPFAIAYPTFSAPAAAAVETAGTAFTVTWADNGDAPSVADLATYQLDVMAGDNTNFASVITVVAPGTALTGLTTSVTVPAANAGVKTNA